MIPTVVESNLLAFPCEVAIIVNKCSAAVTLFLGVKLTWKSEVVLLATSSITAGNDISHWGFMTSTEIL